MDERTEFGKALSTWVDENRARTESSAELVGALIGVAAGEHVFLGETKEAFLRICEYAFDETKKTFDEMKS